MLLLFLILVLAAAEPAASLIRGPFEGSFSVRTSVVVLDAQRNLETRARLHESYSAPLKRARISYELVQPQSDSPRGLFIGSTSHLLTIDAHSNTCRLASLAELRALFDLDARWWHETGGSHLEHIVGPARLLLLVEQHRDQMELMASDADSPSVELLHNLPKRSYSLQLEGALISVHYLAVDKDNDKEEQQRPLAIQLTEGSRITQLAFSQLRPLADQANEATYEENFEESLDLDEDVRLGPFAYPPLAGCIGALAARGLGERLFAAPPQDGSRRPRGVEAPAGKFSFQLRLKTLATWRRKDEAAEFVTSARVAYARQLGSLAVSVRSSRGWWRQLLQLPARRLYMFTETPSEGDEDVDNQATDGGQADWCVATRTQGSYTDAREVEADEEELARVLLGAGSFVRLGEALVAGEPSDLWATTNGSLPRWLEQRQEYRQRDEQGGAGQLKMRPVDSGNARTLVYLAAQTRRPRRLDIRQQFTRHKAELFNFLWDLDQGRAPSEHFALGAACRIPQTAQGDTSAVGRLELELVGGADLGRTPAKLRNLALLASLRQSLQLEAIMVSSLQARWMRQNNQSRLVAQLEVTAPGDLVTDLEYLGQGYVNYRAQSVRFSARTFQVCLSLAARDGRDRHFGYDALARKCFIDRQPEADATNLFKLDKREPMELYWLRHTRVSSDEARWAREMGSEQFRRRATNLQLSLFGRPFTLRRFKATTMAQSSELPAAATTTGGSSLQGFGLRAEGDERVRRLEPARLQHLGPLSTYLEEEEEIPAAAGGDLTAMSYEQCHAACLASTTCFSFSLCLRHFRLECLHSPYQFLQSLDRLRATLATTNSTRGLVRVHVDSGQLQVDLVRHPNCQLHHKSALEMFGRAAQGFRLSIGGHHQRRLYSSLARGREQCAQRCLRRNQELMADDMRLAREASDLFASSQDDWLHHQRLATIIEAHRNNSERLCRAFYYVERATLDEQQEATVKSWLASSGLERERAGEEEEVAADAGYCALGDSIGEESATGASGGPDISFERRPFRAELFYERQEGVKLLESPLTPEERADYRQVTHSHSRSRNKRPATSEEEEEGGELMGAYGRVRSLLLLGDNFQNRHFAGATHCALACLLQSLGPWPACRSFDLVEAQESGSGGGSFTLCQLNSVTLRQAQATGRSDLIDRNGSHEGRIWHYEPLAASLFDSLDEALDTQLDGDCVSHRWWLWWPLLLVVFLVATLAGHKLGSLRLDARRIRTDRRPILPANELHQLEEARPPAGLACDNQL